MERCMPNKAQWRLIRETSISAITVAGFSECKKKILSGENLQLMKVTGKGEVFFSDFGAEIQIIRLENDSLTINTPNLLAFESSLRWDIKLVKPGMQMLAAG